MKMFLEKVIFVNRAPFDKLELDFKENEIAVITAVNGRGKTTILSHIVDAFHEMARPNFPTEFEDKANKFYRISSAIDNLDQSQPSFVYFRFKTSDQTLVDYADVRGNCTEPQYDSAIGLSNKIPFGTLKPQLEQNGYAKITSTNFDKKIAKDLFSNNVLTYFPSYRFETPSYLNDPYQIQMAFNKKTRFEGNLNNPIEVVSGLEKIANWIMDVVLDMNIQTTPNQSNLLPNLNAILNQAIISKEQGSLRLGIGPRGFGSIRLQVMKAMSNEQLYPSIFRMSAGELSILCIFAEIVRQSDTNTNDIKLEEITGIVLIDEVDKHLHIKLQKEALPTLFQFFPNIQFIVSSHSPFLAMGLADHALNRSKIVDLDSFGISRDPTSNQLYAEVYEMMLGENEKFKTMYQTLKQQIQNGTKPLVVTEGKTDVQHIKKALDKLKVTDLDIDFHPIQGDWGDSKLMPLLDNLCKVQNTRKIIGIFDRDVENVVKDIENNGQPYNNFGNNVYAFCIPKPPHRQHYSNISIEFYYTDDELKKERDGKRLYFDNEVGLIVMKQKQKNAKPEIHFFDTPKADFENTKKIFDENIGDSQKIHSKARFADLIETEATYAQDFDFSHFHLIINKIKEITELPQV